MELWIVGKIREYGLAGSWWEFQGVFSEEQLAINACLNEQYFIAPAILNEFIADESVEWLGAYYPKEKINV